MVLLSLSVRSPDIKTAPIDYELVSGVEGTLNNGMDFDISVLRERQNGYYFSGHNLKIGYKEILHADAYYRGAQSLSVQSITYTPFSFLSGKMKMGVGVEANHWIKPITVYALYYRDSALNLVAMTSLKTYSVELNYDGLKFGGLSPRLEFRQINDNRFFWLKIFYKMRLL